MISVNNAVEKDLAFSRKKSSLFSTQKAAMLLLLFPFTEKEMKKNLRCSSWWLFWSCLWSFLWQETLFCHKMYRKRKKGQILLQKLIFTFVKYFFLCLPLVIVLNKKISESHATKFTFDDKLEFSWKFFPEKRGVVCHTSNFFYECWQIVSHDIVVLVPSYSMLFTLAHLWDLVPKTRW